MQLNISSDYAIRAMLYIASSSKLTNASDISQAMNIPVNTCKRNLQLLKNAELLTSRAGVSGGYSLAKNPNEISLADILNAVGEKLELNRCLESDCFCNRSATNFCPVHKVYSEAQASLNKAFSTTLQELMQCPNEQNK